MIALNFFWTGLNAPETHSGSAVVHGGGKRKDVQALHCELSLRLEHDHMRSKPEWTSYIDNFPQHDEREWRWKYAMNPGIVS